MVVEVFVVVTVVTVDGCVTLEVVGDPGVDVDRFDVGSSVVVTLVTISSSTVKYRLSDLRCYFQYGFQMV